MKFLWNKGGLTVGSWLLLFVCMALFSSCSEDEGPVEGIPVESVTLSSSSLTMKVGETVMLTATVLPDNATVQSLVWSSSNREVATVSDKGVVTAAAAGEATVTVAADDKSAVCMVEVYDETDPDQPIFIDGEKADIYLDRFTTSEEVAEAIQKADRKGVKEYTLFGSFDKLGISAETNPFRKLHAEVIDMTNVTGWPEVEADTVSHTRTLEGVPNNSFGCGDSSPDVYFLKKVILPECVKIVGQDAFRNCRYLQEVIMRGVRMVSTNSFSGCSSLNQVDAPLLEIVGTVAFGDCDRWEKVYLPSVKEVGEVAFEHCDYLKEIDLPEAIILRERSFRSCEKLTTLELTSPGAISLSRDAFGGFESSACHLVLNGNKKEEVSGNVWKEVVWKRISLTGKSL